MVSLLDRAHRIADEVLFPAARPRWTRAGRSRPAISTCWPRRASTDWRRRPSTAVRCWARPRCSAYRAAGTLAAATGGDALVSLDHAQRLVREAIFTLVAAGRPEIKAELLGLFTG